jgi:hypothetical protein
MDKFAFQIVGEIILGIVTLVMAVVLLPVITFGRVRVEPLGSNIKFRNGVHRAPDGTIVLEAELAATITLLVAIALAVGWFMVFG